MIYHTFVYLGRVEFDKHWFIHGEVVQVFVKPDTVDWMDRIHQLSGYPGLRSKEWKKEGRVKMPRLYLVTACMAAAR